MRGEPSYVDEMQCQKQQQPFKINWKVLIGVKVYQFFIIYRFNHLLISLVFNLFSNSEHCFQPNPEINQHVPLFQNTIARHQDKARTAVRRHLLSLAASQPPPASLPLPATASSVTSRSRKSNMTPWSNQLGAAFIITLSHLTFSYW